MPPLLAMKPRRGPAEPRFRSSDSLSDSVGLSLPFFFAFSGVGVGWVLAFGSAGMSESDSEEEEIMMAVARVFFDFGSRGTSVIRVSLGAVADEAV